MQLDNNSALVDADFMFHVSEINRSAPEISEMLKVAFEAVGIVAVIHPLVYEKELCKNEKITAIFNAGIVSTITLDEIFGDNEVKKEYYKSVVLDLYRSLKGEDLDLGKESVFTYWKRKCIYILEKTK